MTALARTTIGTFLILIGAVAVGFAIPLAWLWIGAQIQGTSEVTHMTKTTAVAMFPGIVISYAVALHFAALFRARRTETAGSTPPPRRYAWNRSMRDQPETEAATPLEKMCIAAAVIVTIAFEIWFFLFARSPI